MPNLGTTELIIIALLILVLFGAKRLPDSARSLGRSMRIFKAETKGLRDDSDTTVPPPSVTAAPGTSVHPPATPSAPPSTVDVHDPGADPARHPQP